MCQVALIVDVADAIVDALNSESWTEAFTAERKYLPKGSLKKGDFASLSVTVLPLAYEPDMASRGGTEEDVTISIGVQKHTGDDDSTLIDPLIDLCESIAQFFRGRQLGTANPVTCYEATYAPVYITDHLEQFGVFTGLVTIKCKTVR
jgi:hypothetical protein